MIKRYLFASIFFFGMSYIFAYGMPEEALIMSPFLAFLGGMYLHSSFEDKEDLK